MKRGDDSGEHDARLKIKHDDSIEARDGNDGGPWRGWCPECGWHGDTWFAAQAGARRDAELHVATANQLPLALHWGSRPHEDRLENPPGLWWAVGVALTIVACIVIGVIILFHR